MATNKKSRLAEIYRSEKKKGGGVVSTLAKGAAERIDPRRMFNQKGFLATAFPSMFKAYLAAPSSALTGKKITPSPASNITGDFGILTKQITGLSTQMHEVAVNSTIIAKNTMVLPAMARDTNITRQNISKLVKLQGDTASKKTDMFFKRASERESAYESKFKKESGKGVTAPAGTTPSSPDNTKNLGFIGILKGLSDAVSKGVGIAALGVGIGGFFAGLALGGAAVNALGGASGVKDMLINLAEGLNAFSLGSFTMFSSLLAAGGIFGAVSGLKTKGGAVLGIGAVGLGIGLFFSGLAAGGAIGDMIGNSAGIRDMMVNFAEGLNAFNPASMSAFKELLAAGGIFGAVAGAAAMIPGVGALASAAVTGGATLGMGAIGTGIGLFLAGIASGDKLISLISAGSSPGASIKELLVNVSDGIKSFQDIDVEKIFSVTKLLPVLGVSMLGYFGPKGIGGVISAIGDKMSSFFSFVFGTENKSPLERLSEDLQKFNNINGDNLSKIGKGFKDLVEGANLLSTTTTPASAPPAPPAPAPAPAPAETSRMSAPTPSVSNENYGNEGRRIAPSTTTETQHAPVASGQSGAEDKPNLTRITSKEGLSTLVNAEYAPRFQKLLDWFGSVGYKIKSLGGYVDRDVTGQPGVKSVHAHGAAIDINPAENPYGSTLITDMPPETGQVAASLGLGWGGNWKSPKDAMHFSVASNEGGDVNIPRSSRPTPETNTSTKGSNLNQASASVSNEQRSALAPNITVVASQNSQNSVRPVQQMVSGSIASPVDRELSRTNKWLGRQTSLTRG